METFTQNRLTGKLVILPKAMQIFFASNSVLSTKVKLFHFLKSYVSQPDAGKPYTEEEITLFLDQLIDLVAAAKQLHEAGRVDQPNEVHSKEAGHD